MNVMSIEGHWEDQTALRPQAEGTTAILLHSHSEIILLIVGQFTVYHFNTCLFSPTFVLCLFSTNIVAPSQDTEAVRSGGALHQGGRGAEIKPAQFPEPHTLVMGCVRQRKAGFFLFCTKAPSITKPCATGAVSA